MGETHDYRSRIYKEYASRFQDANPVFDPAAAARWGKAYDWYFRGWMPGSKEAAVCDLGCGGGSLLHFFQTRGYANLTGVDVSPQQVALARQVAPNVHQASVLDFLESHPGSFDLLTGLDIVEHFTKDELLRFLDGCHASLKPGGRIILQTPNMESPRGAVIRYGDLTHEIGLQPNSLSRILGLCGFQKPSFREAGPPGLGYSLSATLRWLLWQVIRAGLMFYDFTETGNTGSRIYTRILFASASRG